MGPTTAFALIPNLATWSPPRSWTEKGAPNILSWCERTMESSRLTWGWTSLSKTSMTTRPSSPVRHTHLTSPRTWRQVRSLNGAYGYKLNTPKWTEQVMFCLLENVSEQTNTAQGELFFLCIFSKHFMCCSSEIFSIFLKREIKSLVGQMGNNSNLIYSLWQLSGRPHSPLLALNKSW